MSSKEQIAYFESLKPDLAILPELREKNIDLLKPSSAIWATNNHTTKSAKGLGVLGFNGVQLTGLPRDDEMEIYIPVMVTAGASRLNLLAVWNFYSACKQGRFKGNRKTPVEYAALEHYKSHFQDPSLVAGDWNFGPTFSKHAFIKISEILGASHLQSIYHQRHKLKMGEEDYVTFKTVRGSKFHILDHIFGSPKILAGVKEIWVEPFERVVRSDHAPMILQM